MPDNEGQDDKAADKGNEGAPPNGGAPAGGPDDAADKGKDEGGKPNGDRGPGRPRDDDADWKARARQHEDRAKAHKKDLDATLAERDGLKGVLDSLRKALDPDGAGKDADPAELAQVAAQERDQARAEVKLARVELAAERAARKAGADVDALLDSRGFLTRIADLDPTDDGFAAAVETAVRDAVRERPSLKSTTAPPRSGNADMTSGGAAGTGQLTRADLKNMSPKAIEKARADGRLKDLLGG
jgi:hypothetical protein